jgi:hypothetical protein
MKILGTEYGSLPPKPLRSLYTTAFSWIINFGSPFLSSREVFFLFS